MIRAALVFALLLGVPAGAQEDAREAAPPAAPPVEDAAALSVDDAPPPASGESALVRRLSDNVAVRIGPQAIERVLYYFSPTAELAAGDELEQGSGGHSEIGLPAGGRVQLHATAHMILQQLDPAGDVLVFPLVTKARITSLLRPLTVVVPGGAQCIFQGTEIEVHTEPGRIVVRNQGGLPVEMLGLLSLERGATKHTSLEGVGRIVLERGQEVALPLFRLLPVGRGVQVVNWNRLTLRHAGAWEIEESPASIRVARLARAADAPASAVAALDDLTVAGVRVRAGPGAALQLANLRRPVPEARLNLAHYRASAPEGAGLPLEPLQLLALVTEGITLEGLRIRGYEVDEALYAKAKAYVDQQAAAGDPAAPAEPDETPNESNDTVDETPEGNQP